MTKETAELFTNEQLVDLFSDAYGQSVFCPDSVWNKNEVEVLKAEILRRMKNEK